MNPFQSIVHIVFFSGGIAVTLSFLFLLFALILHFLNQRREAYENRFAEQMRPYLMRSLFEDSLTLPTLSKKDRITFLDLWNRFHQSLKGSSKEKLNQLAYQNHLDQLAFSLFQKKSFYKKMLAIWTFGHLKEKKVWDDLIDLLNHSDSYLSLAASQALLRIDARSAISLLVPFFVSRRDWPPTKVVEILRETESGVINHSHSKFFLNAPADRISLFLRYLEILWTPSFSPTVRKILHSTSDPSILAAGLRLLQTPADLPIIRHYLKDPNEEIRGQATKALGRIVTEDDVPLLISLLSDPAWWVRYQAANGLMNFAFVGIEGLKKIEIEQMNPLAKEIVTFVIAEKEFG